MVRNVFFKLLRTVFIVVISIIAYDYIRTFNDVFYKTKTANVFVRKNLIRIGTVLHINCPDYLSYLFNYNTQNTLNQIFISYHNI